MTLIDRTQLMAMMAMAAEVGGRGGGPLRVLVIEDEALVALEIESFLTAAGHVVVGVAEDRASAATLVQQAEPRPDLALVDMLGQWRQRTAGRR